MFAYSMVAVFAAAATASVGVFVDGPCPTVGTMSEFDFNSYSGIWYEIARFPNAGEVGDKGRCTTTQYYVNGLRGKFKSTHVVDGVKAYVEGDITLIGPAQIMLTYTFGGKARNTYLSILDTDYVNYAIGYSCRYSKKTGKRQVSSWIFSRSKSLERSAGLAVDKHLARRANIIDRSLFVYNNHSKEACRADSTKRINDFLDERRVQPNVID